METEIIIAADDPVRLVSAVVERMYIRKIERSYSQDGRNEYPPRILLKVMIYAYFEELKDIALFVKPSNHEQRKTKKYRTDISRRENMAYNAETDTYTCANGKAITFDAIKKTTSQNGFKIETSVYSCKDCAGCPMKAKCIRACGSKKPLEERNKVIYVSKRFARQREEMEERISTDEGKLIRVNRSIQAEGVFAMTKEDMGFRRFLLRSAVKVEVEWTLLSLAYNILKLHHKIQKQRLGTGLVIPKSVRVGRNKPRSVGR